MSKSKFIIDRFTKLIEQGLISYKDLNREILNIIKSKKEEIIFKLDLPTKEEFEVLKKRVEFLESKIVKKKNKKIQKGKKILTLRPPRGDFSNLILPPCD